MDMMEAMGIRGNDPLVDEEHHDTTKGKVEVYMHGRLVEVTGVASSPPQVTAFPPPSSTPTRESTKFIFGENLSSTPAGMSQSCCARTEVGCGVAAEVDAAAATTRQQGQSRKHSQRHQRQDTQQKGRLQRMACRHRPS